MKEPHPLRRLLADLTDPLFGFRPRHRPWRRLFAWLLSALVVALLILMSAALSDWEVRVFLGTRGQLFAAVGMLLAVPVAASRAFGRERDGGNMLDLVLVPVEPRRIVLGRLGRVLIPSVLLLALALPAYLAAPPYERLWSFMEVSSRMIVESLNVPAAVAWPLRHVTGEKIFASAPTLPTFGWLAGFIPFSAMLAESAFLAALGVFFSLRVRTWRVALLCTYTAAALALLLEAAVLPAMLWGRLWGMDWPAAFALAGVLTTLLVRAGGSVWLLRRAIRNFDRYVVAEEPWFLWRRGRPSRNALAEK